MGLFSRDGHLLDLSLERFAADDLQEESRQELTQHLDACEECRRRFSVLSEPISMPPLSLPARPALKLMPGGKGLSPPPPPPAEAPSWRRYAWASPLIAVAAVALFWIQPSSETFTRRGGKNLVLEVYRQTGGVSQRLQSGDPVSDGDRLGFRIRSDHDGYLLISGKDGAGHLYPCYPSAGPAEALAGSPDAVALPAAVQMDATPGEETLTATLCPAPFDLNTLSTLPEGCQQITIVLPKKSL